VTAPCYSLVKLWCWLFFRNGGFLLSLTFSLRSKRKYHYWNRGSSHRAVLGSRNFSVSWGW
jgi:hypothetical protein